MSAHSIKPALAALHAELGKTTAVDDETRALLRQVAADIERALDEGAPHPEDAASTLEARALTFEAKHPALTEAIQAVAQLLRGAGV